MKFVSTDQKRHRQGEQGNVLFLILIAVALFAALSYAVTQSSRSGGKDASSETNLINSAQITQYPSGVRTSIVRMIIGGIDATDLQFNIPANFSATGAVATEQVFNPAGGNATYQSAPPDVMELTGDQGTWFFNASFEIQNIGSTTADGAGNEIVAFLPMLKEAVCKRINSQLGISQDTGSPNTTGVPEIAQATSVFEASRVSDGTGLLESGEDLTAPTATIGASATDSALSGQPFGCFETSDEEFVYYHVLIER